MSVNRMDFNAMRRDYLERRTTRVGANTSQLALLISSYRAHLSTAATSNTILASSELMGSDVKVIPQTSLAKWTSHPLVTSTHDIIPTILIMAGFKKPRMTESSSDFPLIYSQLLDGDRGASPSSLRNFVLEMVRQPSSPKAVVRTQTVHDSPLLTSELKRTNADDKQHTVEIKREIEIEDTNSSDDYDMIDYLLQQDL